MPSADTTRRAAVRGLGSTLSLLFLVVLPGAGLVQKYAGLWGVCVVFAWTLALLAVLRRALLAESPWISERTAGLLLIGLVIAAVFAGVGLRRRPLLELCVRRRCLCLVGASARGRSILAAPFDSGSLRRDRDLVPTSLCVGGGPPVCAHATSRGRARHRHAGVRQLAHGRGHHVALLLAFASALFATSRGLDAPRVFGPVQ